MTGFLRFLGTVNAAIWLGAAVSFTFVAIPAFFSADMKALFQENVESIFGSMAMVAFSRFFVLQYICGAVALAHAFAGFLYLGRPLKTLTNSLLLLVLGLSLLGGFALQPQIRNLHFQKYNSQASTEQQAQSAKTLRVYHGLSQVLNLIALGGLAAYFWRVTYPGDPTRVAAFTHKFRG